MAEESARKRASRARNGRKPKPRPEPGADGMHHITAVTLDGASYAACADLTRDKLRKDWRESGRVRVRFIRTPQLPRVVGRKMLHRNRMSLQWGARSTGGWLEDREMSSFAWLEGAHHALWWVGWHLSCIDANQCAAVLGEPAPWRDARHAEIVFTDLYAEGLPSPLDPGRMFDPAVPRYPADVAGVISEGASWRLPEA